MDSWLKENGVPILIGIALATLMYGMNMDLKGDIMDLKGEIRAVSSGTETRLTELENRLKDDIERVETSLGMRLTQLETRLGRVETRLADVVSDDIPEVRERLAAIEALTKDIHSVSIGRLPPDFTDAVARRVAEILASNPSRETGGVEPRVPAVVP